MMVEDGSICRYIVDMEDDVRTESAIGSGDAKALLLTCVALVLVVGEEGAFFRCLAAEQRVIRVTGRAVVADSGWILEATVVAVVLCG